MLELERKHGISLEQADWETRQPPNAIEVDGENKMMVIPLSVIKEKWGFIPSERHAQEERMQECLKDLASILTESSAIPLVQDWTDVVRNDKDFQSFLIFW